MTSVRRVGIQVGLAGGLAFFLHALVPYSRSYPFIWPVLAGAVAAWMATTDVSAHRGRHGMLAVLIAGAVVGLVAAVGLSITLLVLRPSIVDAAGPARAGGAVSAAGISFISLTLIAAVATWIGGAVAIPFRLWRKAAVS
jgi:hypothetical protein